MKSEHHGIDAPSISKGVSQRLARGWYVLRYYRKSQIARRLFNLTRRAIGRVFGPRRSIPLDVVAPLRESADFSAIVRRKFARHRIAAAMASAKALCQGRFELLATERILSDPIDWRLTAWPDTPQLWRFHLHYQDYLLDLALAGKQTADSAFVGRAWSLIEQWIHGNPIDDLHTLNDAWHPFCISRRIPNWIILWNAAAPPEELSEPVGRSLAQQAEYLFRHLEWDLRGNHLLENLRGVLMAGVMFSGPRAESWLDRGEAILRNEISEQILPCGEHFERTPMYHALMLELLLDLRDSLACCRPELSEFCGATARRMADFLEAILHPDSEIPLFGDSAFGEHMEPRRLIAEARAEPLDVSPEHDADREVAGVGACVTGDYWTFRDDLGFLLFDAGPVGADHLPAHAHADLLNLEVSIHGQRMIVDSGVFSYADDAMRRYCRSTPAHNTLVVDGMNQCDVWSKFRMGYRGWPRNFESGRTAEFAWCRAAHNAYRRCGVAQVWRWIACRAGGPWICLDWADTQGSHELTSRLHLHPDVVVEPMAEDQFLIRVAGVTLRLAYFAGGDISLKRGWYCPRFGQRFETNVILWRAKTPAQQVCGWCLTDETTAGSMCWENISGRMSLNWSDPSGQIRLEPFGR